MNENPEPAEAIEEEEEIQQFDPADTQTPQLRWWNRFGSELASLFGGMMVVAVGFLLLVIITWMFGESEGVSGYISGAFGFYMLVASVIIGMASFILMLFFIDKAEEREMYETKRTGYVINSWRIHTMSTAGLPQDIITGLERILSEKASGKKNPELLMKRPFEVDAWLYLLGDLLGENRVIEYEDQLLKHTKTKV
ncbi:MAG: hypothetical protein HKN25_09150 [Pyrinomonadaceae bacterium]|nr:hypothetical protein [Pyrinomonadaceae bacterium]